MSSYKTHQVKASQFRLCKHARTKHPTSGYVNTPGPSIPLLIIQTYQVQVTHFSLCPGFTPPSEIGGPLTSGVIDIEAVILYEAINHGVTYTTLHYEQFTAYKGTDLRCSGHAEQNRTFCLSKENTDCVRSNAHIVFD